MAMTCVISQIDASKPNTADFHKTMHFKMKITVNSECISFFKLSSVLASSYNLDLNIRRKTLHTSIQCPMLSCFPGSVNSEHYMTTKPKKFTTVHSSETSKPKKQQICRRLCTVQLALRFTFQFSQHNNLHNQILEPLATRIVSSPSL